MDQYILAIAVIAIIVLGVAFLIRSAQVHAYKDAAKKPIYIEQNANPVINVGGASGGKTSNRVAGFVAIGVIAAVLFLALRPASVPAKVSTSVSEHSMDRIPKIVSVPVVAEPVQVPTLPEISSVAVYPETNWGAIIALLMFALVVIFMVWAETITRPSKATELQHPELAPINTEERPLWDFAEKASEELERVEK